MFWSGSLHSLLSRSVVFFLVRLWSSVTSILKFDKDLRDWLEARRVCVISMLYPPAQVLLSLLLIHLFLLRRCCCWDCYSQREIITSNCLILLWLLLLLEVVRDPDTRAKYFQRPKEVICEQLNTSSIMIMTTRGCTTAAPQYNR